MLLTLAELAPITVHCLCLMQEEMVYEWLNPIYLKPDVQEQIREKFEADSEIELWGFLKVCLCWFMLAAF